ncbi:hypothetical protein [Streptomyces sp. NBC_01012]|uniref:hypothetical protein n=1 Tax=Streptomyces sp. NBC_01012 TaxID=2903717 RepID=UPI0038643ABF|nr:hypothetical protein OG623_22240 [Streptomyces sp. NBC_01012]
MPEETATATQPPSGPVLPARSRPRGRASALWAVGCGCTALVVLVLALFVRLAWGSSDFPRVAPEDAAGRAFQRSQEAYDVMGFTRTVRPGVEDIGVSTENTLGAGSCYSGGLLSLDEPVAGAYQMSHRWALNHVPASQAVPGLRRLHQQLMDDGWDVTSYRDGEKDNWDLFVQRDDGDERMYFTWFPDREYFMGSATGPCAYDPGWQEGDTGSVDDGLRPPTLRPARPS